MKVVIVGCGRVGSVLAGTFDAGGHEVIILDTSTRAFDRLPANFSGRAVRGNGTDADVLRRVDATGCDLFLALTEGDNRNVMAAQIAQENLGAKRVIAKVNDPVRADAYAHLGLPTICRTNMMVDTILTFLDLPAISGPGIAAASGHFHAPDGSHEAGRAASDSGTSGGTEASGASSVSGSEHPEA